MKNNKMMRAASGLMIATLLTTSMISGTFAKYTTQSDGGDSARVAKWGVNLGVSGSLYGDAYDGTNHTIVANNDSAVTVKSVDQSKVVAPGTKNANSGLHITLNGKPEVSTKVYGTIKTQNIYLAAGEYGVMVEANSVKAEDFVTGNKYYTESNGTYTETSTYADNTTYYTLEDAANLGTTYYPVVYTGAGVTNGTTATDSLAEIGQGIAGMLSKSAVTGPTTTVDGVNTYEVKMADVDAYAPNIDLATGKLANINSANITWEWAFTGNDAEDTILGDLSAATPDAQSNIVYKVNADYKAVTVNKTTGLATVSKNTANDTTVASLKTSLSIDLTVEQVD